MQYGYCLECIQSYYQPTYIPLSAHATLLQGGNDQGKSVLGKAIHVFAAPYDNDEYDSLISFDCETGYINTYLDNHEVMRCILQRIPERKTIQVTFLLTKGQEIIKSWFGWHQEVAEYIGYIVMHDTRGMYYTPNFVESDLQYLVNTDKITNAYFIDSIQKDLSLETRIANLTEAVKKDKEVIKSRQAAARHIRTKMMVSSYVDTTKGHKLLDIARQTQALAKHTYYSFRYTREFKWLCCATSRYIVLDKYLKLLQQLTILDVHKNILDLKKQSTLLQEKQTILKKYIFTLQSLKYFKYFKHQQALRKNTTLLQNILISHLKFYILHTLRRCIVTNQSSDFLKSALIKRDQLCYIQLTNRSLKLTDLFNTSTTQVKAYYYSKSCLNYIKYYSLMQGIHTQLSLLQQIKQSWQLHQQMLSYIQITISNNKIISKTLILNQYLYKSTCLQLSLLNISRFILIYQKAYPLLKQYALVNIQYNYLQETINSKQIKRGICPTCGQPLQERCSIKCL